jgi:hypothetical protein
MAHFPSERIRLTKYGFAKSHGVVLACSPLWMMMSRIVMGSMSQALVVFWDNMAETNRMRVEQKEAELRAA